MRSESRRAVVLFALKADDAADQYRAYDADDDVDVSGLIENMWKQIVHELIHKTPLFRFSDCVIVSLSTPKVN